MTGKHSKALLIITSASVGALELVVNDGLGTGLDACCVVSHWVHTSFSWVDLDNLFQFNLASLQFSLPVFALRLAGLENLRFGILSCSELRLYVVGLSDTWSLSVIIDRPSWGKPASDSTSHFYLFI